MTRSDPKVGLGLPVYNGEEFLTETLDSLLAQTFSDFELVISDNASTDGTQAICEDYAERDPRIRYVRHPENRGAAWNFGEAFRLSRGEYFKWCTHDDLCLPEFLETCVRILDQNPSVAWCMTGIEVIDRYGGSLDDVPAPSSGAAEPIALETLSSEGEMPLNADFARPRQRFLKVLVGQPACMDIHGLMRASVLGQTGLWRHYRGCEKVVMAEMAVLGRGVEIPLPLFQYRFHSNASIALADFRAQQAWCDPRRNWRYVFPRITLVADFVRTALRHPIGLTQRIRCLGAVAQYLLQLGKWTQALRRMFGGTGMDADNRERLREIETRAIGKRKAILETSAPRSTHP